MVFVVAGFLCVFATSPPVGSCATSDGNRCGGYVSNGCGCDADCLNRNNCCTDYSTVCVGACPVNSADSLICRDGTECDPMDHPDAYACCGTHGGKYKCPSSLPYMCSGANGESCGDDHCCFNTPFMCGHFSVDRSLLQDCPALQSDTPSICPHLHGPQQLLPNMTIAIGSYAHRFWMQESDLMITLAGGKFAPGWKWEYCTPHDEAVKLLCKSGKQCDVLVDGWGCCAEEGGRLRCPAEFPVMCELKECAGDDHCCGPSANACNVRPLKECPTSEVDIPATNDTTIRQCSANAPVLCKNNTCAFVKSECAEIQTECPEVPQCEATGEWEATPVGSAAYALCGKDTNGTLREGRKFRTCVSKFDADDQEIAVWDRIVDDDQVCRPVSPKCSYVKTEGGDRIPVLPVGAFARVPKTNCPHGRYGVTVYHCIVLPITNETKLDMTPLCDLPCTREGYCNGYGDATPVAHDLSMGFGYSCSCACDPSSSGEHCAIPSGRPVERESRTSYGMLSLCIGLLIAVIVLSVCLVKSKMRKAHAQKEVKKTEITETETETEGEQNASCEVDESLKPPVNTRE